MIMQRAAAAAIITSVCLCNALASDKHKIECPAEIPAAATSVKPPDGWTTFIAGELRLKSAEPMLGPPEKMAFLKPSRTKSTAAGSVDSWLELDGSPPQASGLLAATANAVRSFWPKD
ncbi:MAG: STY0301 family protein [Bryobacteraceae bacterium]